MFQFLKNLFKKKEPEKIEEINDPKPAGNTAEMFQHIEDTIARAYASALREIGEDVDPDNLSQEDKELYANIGSSLIAACYCFGSYEEEEEP